MDDELRSIAEKHTANTTNKEALLDRLVEQAHEAAHQGAMSCEIQLPSNTLVRYWILMKLSELGFRVEDRYGSAFTIRWGRD